MAKISHRQRKEELIATLNHKRESIAQKTNNLQTAITLRKPASPIPRSGWLNPNPEDQNVMQTSSNSSSNQFVSAAIQRFSAVPIIGKALGFSNNLGSKLPSKIISKKAAKPILLGLGGSFVLLMILGGRKRARKRKAEKHASMEKVTKPALGFLILKTVLSVAEPAMKQIVKNQVSKRK